MRALTASLASLAVVFAACGGSEPTAAPPPAPTPTVAAEATAAPTAAVAAAPTATASAAPEPPKPASPCPAAMALVPGGTYKMGRSHLQVTVASVCMDVNETTADEYAACAKAGKCSTSNLK